jgi:phage gp45-like
MVQIAKVNDVMDDSQLFPQIRIDYLENIVDAVVANPYGIHSSPEIKTPLLLITINGNEANRIVIPLSAFARNKGLKEGEVETGNFKVGSTIKFDELGNITVVSQKDIIVSSQGEIVFNADGGARFNCDVEIVGTLEASVDVVAGEISLKDHENDAGSNLKDGNSLSCTGKTGKPV